MNNVTPFVVSMENQKIHTKPKTSPNKPTNLIECPYCRAKGKDMFFFALQDLVTHVRRIHGHSEGEWS